MEPPKLLTRQPAHDRPRELILTPDGGLHPNRPQLTRRLTHVYSRVCDLTNLQLALACYDLTSSHLDCDPTSHDWFPFKAFG